MRIKHEEIILNQQDFAIGVMEKGLLITISLIGAAAVAYAVPRICSEIRNRPEAGDDQTINS